MIYWWHFGSAPVQCGRQWMEERLWGWRRKDEGDRETETSEKEKSEGLREGQKLALTKKDLGKKEERRKYLKSGRLWLNLIYAYIFTLKPFFWAKRFRYACLLCWRKETTKTQFINLMLVCWMESCRLNKVSHSATVFWLQQSWDWRWTCWAEASRLTGSQPPA